MEWKIDTGVLKKKERVILEGIFELDYLELDIGKMPILEPVKVKMVVVRAKDGIAVGGFVKTAIEHPCTRCLTPVRLEINGTIEALYVPEAYRDEKSEVELENLRNVIYYKNPVIDLTDRIIEAMVLEVPEQVLCRPDCKGLCPYCGINLNEHPDHVCDKKPEFNVVNNKFAILEKFKEKLREG
ncbi:MAG: DUF177 domain-containing protein [Thermotogaceae bacterium]|nr:DUF177 domain-containing protein [Thermotogaceae bacterium]